MNYLSAILMVKKKLKLIIYLCFYLIISLIGIYFIKLSKYESDLILLSIGLSFLTISMGFFFFIGYDYLEHEKTVLKVICRIIGVVFMIVITIPHFWIDIKSNVLNLYTFTIGCYPEYVWKLGFACCSYIYWFVSRRIFILTIEHYVSEDKKLFIQLLLPVVCYTLMVFFLRIGLAWLCFILIAYFSFIRTITNKRKVRKKTKSNKIREAVFGEKE